MTRHRSRRRGRCHYCKAPATTRDHIWPKALGGKDVLWNIVAACRPCNGAKGADLPTCECRKCIRAFYRMVDFLVRPIGRFDVPYLRGRSIARAVFRER